MKKYIAPGNPVLGCDARPRAGRHGERMRGDEELRDGRRRHRQRDARAVGHIRLCARLDVEQSAVVLPRRRSRDADAAIAHRLRGVAAGKELERSLRAGRQRRVGRHHLSSVLLGQMLKRGHATASTDNGHTGSPIDGRWAIGQPEKVRDFAERAVHLLSDIGKRITAKYYETAAKRSYFFGCSEGGREALIEAQRFPRGLRRHRLRRARRLLDRSVDRLRVERPGAAQGSGELHPAGQAADAFRRPRSRLAMRTMA